MASISSSLDATPDFVYEPLQPDEIRILQLAPDHKGHALIGKLSIANIEDSAIKYDALSYMWGDPAPADRIYISGKALLIASNLTVALHHLRHADKSLSIWIDAICIDQQNYDERAEQVQLMRKLYKRADTVRIWINEPGIDSKCDAVTALQNFPRVGNDPIALLKSMGEDPIFWDPVVPIFANKYWNRAWIQQEVLNATRLSLHCMHIVVDGAPLARFQRAAMLRFSAAYRSVSVSEMIWLKHLRYVTKRYSPAATSMLQYQDGQFPHSLCELLSLPDLHVTKPQDRVYALMHLARDYEGSDIAVDYGKSSLQVMVEAAAYHVRVHRDLRFLYLSYLRESKKEDEDEDQNPSKPTWLPQNWLGELTNYTPDPHFLPRTKQCLPDALDMVDRRLRIRGMKVDHLRHCLIGDMYVHGITPRLFWSSSIGLYLKESAGIGMNTLSNDAFKTLFGPSISQMVVFTLRMNNLEASKGNTFQKYSWGQDEDSDHRTFVTLKKAAISGLDVLLRLSQDSRYADQILFERGELNTVVLDQGGPTAYIALQQVFVGSKFDSIIMTETKALGRLPMCEYRKGDEIWIVLGIDEPLLLRPQPNGYYWHVCAAQIPFLQGHKDFRNFSSNIQPGDKIGEWVVEDIEIE